MRALRARSAQVSLSHCRARARGRRAWKEAYWRRQKGCAMLRVMCCSQKTCSGHCMTAVLRMRLRAYTLRGFGFRGGSCWV